MFGKSLEGLGAVWNGFGEVWNGLESAKNPNSEAS